eukprot:7378144-Prymnesium_polylepis.1
MLGTQNGAAAQLQAKCSSDVIVTHAVAHVSQLTNADAFDEVDYYELWKGGLQDVYLHYHLSGKKRHSLEVIADELGEKLLKVQGTHGIRWAAAQARTIKAFLVDLATIQADLEQTAKAAIGVEYSLLTPSNNFIGKFFWQKWEGHRNKFKATVKEVVPRTPAPTASLPPTRLSYATLMARRV